MDELPPLPSPGFETVSIHHAEDPHRFEGAIIPPIFQNTLFAFESVEQWSEPGRYHYSRDRNPTTDIVQEKLAVMEQGEEARCFGAGMAASICAILSCTKAGDHVVAVCNCYGGVQYFLRSYLDRFGITATFVPGTATEQFEEAMQPNTRVFYLESPTSCYFELQDLPALTALARSREIVTIIDNTYSTPVFQNPIAFGVDLVVHSASKYLGGHSDICGGVVVGRRELMEKVRGEAGLLGAMLDPFASWLLLRGLRTLPIRLERHFQSAMKLATWLEQDPRVEHVNYPALPSNAGHQLFLKQMRGASGLLSFMPKQREDARIARFMNALTYFRLGCSWGGFESLCVRIGREEISATEGRHTIRLHVGLENVEDLIADLDRAMRAL